MGEDDLTGLAAEQAALRRVATLVASGAAPEEVFAAVLEEVGRLLGVDYVHMGRYEPDNTLTVVASWGSARPVVARTMLGGRNLGTIVFETGRPARIDSYARATGPLADGIREQGIRSAVGTPIIVEGRLWGLMAAGSRGEQRSCWGRRAATGVVHGALGDDDRECREPCRSHSTRRGSGRIAARGDARRARSAAGGRVRGGGPGDRAAAARRLRGPGALRARRDDHLRRRVGQDPRRLPRRCPVEARREERHDDWSRRRVVRSGSRAMPMPPGRSVARPVKRAFARPSGRRSPSTGACGA